MSVFCGFTARGDSRNKNILTGMTAKLPGRTENYVTERREYDAGSLNISYNYRDMESVDNNSRDILIIDGKIFNLREIQQELGKNADEPATEIDILRLAINAWGLKETMKRLDGEFALFYTNGRKVFLAHDRFCGRPLYYCHINRTLVFGSRLKSLLKHPECHGDIDFDALELYLHLVFIPSPLTIYKNCRKLPAASLLEFDIATNDLRIEKYWDIGKVFLWPETTMSYIDTQKQFETLLNDAIMRRADTRTGVLLSGGYDSSGIAALLRHAGHAVSTFTVGFNDYEFNEAKLAADIATYLKTDHHEIHCSVNDVISLLEDMPNFYEEPFADTAAIPTMLLAKLASGTTCNVLAGDGGDESLGGYADFYVQEKRLKYFQPEALTTTLAGQALIASSNLIPSRRGKRYFQRIGNALKYNVPPIRGLYTASERRKLLKYRTDKDLSLKSLDCVSPGIVPWSAKGTLLFFYQFFTPDTWLVKTERAAEYGGIEIRQPFLDRKLVEFAINMPLSCKRGPDGRLKKIYRGIVHQYIPQELIERPKQGFGVPLSAWLQKELRPLMMDMLSFSTIKNDGIFDAVAVAKIIKDFQHDPITFEGPLWNLLQFQLWHRASK